MSSEAQRRAISKYMKKQKQIILRCDLEKDADVIDYLASCESANAELRRLVRQEIARREAEN